MYVAELLSALQERLRRDIRNGHLTERGLARRSGISQAHIHNVLKGARTMSPGVADQILSALGISVRDLIPSEFRKPPGIASEEKLQKASSQ
jgi:transcriptional regulator with XRE-family HTH domain